MLARLNAQRCRRHAAWTPATFLVALTMALLSAGPTEAASPPWAKVGLVRSGTGAYTVNSCGADRHAVDPINVVWYGPGATAQNVAHQLWRRGWRHDDRNSPSGSGNPQMVLQRQLRCTGSSAPRATNCAACERDHVRLFQTLVIQDRGSSLRSKRFVVGDVHHDHLSYLGGCGTGPLPVGHVARFNEGRAALMDGWPPTSVRWWGNTRRIRQCDGHAVASNGYVAYYRLKAAAAASASRHPLNENLPHIDGPAQAGQPVTATPGTWFPEQAAFSFQWCYVDESNPGECNPISGATGQTWVVDPTLVGRAIGVRVRPAGVARESEVLSNLEVVVASAAVSKPEIVLGPIGPVEGIPTVAVNPHGGVTRVSWWTGSCEAMGETVPVDCSEGWSGAVEVPAGESPVDLGEYGPRLCGPVDYWIRATNSAGAAWVGPLYDPVYCT